MWYVVQVRTGTEERIRVQCLKNAQSDVIAKCFIPYYEEQKRIRGKWTMQKKVLFPGYVFIITEQIDKAYEELRHIIGLTRLVGTGGEVVPLSGEEKEFLLKFGGEEQVVRMSEGIIEDSRVRVTSGPLQGIEGCIKKIDRHKRKAWLEVEMFGRMQRIEVGLEITEKIEKS